MIIYDFFKNNAMSNILKNIAIEHDRNELARLSNILVVYLLSPMMLFGSIISLGLFLWWGQSIFTSLFFASSHFWIGIGMIYTLTLDISEVKKKKFIGWLIILSSIVTYFLYYSKVGNLYWLTFVIVLLPLTLNSSKSFFYQIFLFIVPSIVFSYYFQKNFILIDVSYYIILSIVMVFCIFIVFIINRILKYILREKAMQFQIITNQKDILISSEHELKYQNEMLNEFNASLEESHELLEHIAYTDELTGLYNRKKMKEKIDDLILLNSNTENIFILVFIDLNEFKRINNIAGHSVGDKFLIKTADKIRAHIDEQDMVFRIGGDEFAIIINREISEENLLIYLRYFMQSIKSPMLIDNHQLYIHASCSVAKWPKDGSNCSELLIAADTAMHEVKRIRGNDIYFFNKALRDKKLNKIEMEYELVRAVKNNEFLLNYQPLIRARDEKIIGFEALIRWNSPVYGLVSPLKFIPIAEDTGLIYEIGKWVILEVCNLINKSSTSCKNCYYSINVSALQLKNPSFIKDIQYILKSTNVDPKRINFEITESVLIDDVDEVNSIIDGIKATGISIAIDDFGTGFSSLSYLINIPIDILKIDKSFIDLILSNKEKLKLIKSIIDMAHSLGMKVVAEGIETKKQADYLGENNCDILQGYHFSRPVDEKTLIEMIEN